MADTHQAYTEGIGFLLHVSTVAYPGSNQGIPEVARLNRWNVGQKTIRLTQHSREKEGKDKDR